jgi:hypothetical protein
MESKDALRQLADAEKLRSVTRTEAQRTPRWAKVTMVVGVFVFWVGIGAASDTIRVALFIGWLVFVASWAVLLRWGRRAQPAHEPMSKRVVLEWVGFVVLANAIALVFSRVSWALVGVLFALLGAGWGALLAWRERRV